MEVQILEQQHAGGCRPEDGPEPVALCLADVDGGIGRVEVPECSWVSCRFDLGVRRPGSQSLARVGPRKTCVTRAETDPGFLGNQQQLPGASHRGWTGAGNGGRYSAAAFVAGVREARDQPALRQWPRQPYRD